MNSQLLIYLLQANLAIILLAIIYRVFLSNNTLYRANRFYLLASLVIALTFQFLPKYQISGTEQMQSSILSIPANLISSDIVAPTSSNFTFWWIIAAVWSVVVVFKSAKMMIGLLAIYRIRRQSTKHYYNSEEYYYVHPGIVPFSFFGSIFLPDSTYGECSDILQHERSHCSNYHSWDLIISELFCILFWYNPASWYLQIQIRNNIEYQADMKTTEGREDKRSYQYQLLEICTNETSDIVATYFNKSNLKKRIMMMNKTKSPRIAIFSYFLLPIALLTLSFTNVSCGSSEKSAKGVDAEVGEIVTGYATSQKSEAADVKVVGYGVRENGSVRLPLDSDKKPLVILDGVEQEEGVDINKLIDVEKIESISVLKDASAVDLYGERGKDGVIVITSK